MASSSELGRNSAAITYGPFTGGQDIWPAFSLVDQWFRQDSLTGSATASGTTITAFGSGPATSWSVQVRAGDTIIMAGQQRTVAASPAITDTSIPVTVAFSPAITVPTSIKVLSLNSGTNIANQANTTTTGYAVPWVRGNTNGVVSVTAGSNVVTGTIDPRTGVSTFFTSEATNSVTLVSVTGTVAVDQYGTITGTGTTFVTSAGSSAGLYPGDSIAITLNGAVQYFQIATVTSDTVATTTWVPPNGPIAAGATIAKATNSVIGRTININGRIRTIQGIASNTSLTLNLAMDFTDSGLHYKVYPRGTVGNAVGATPIGSSSITIPTTNIMTVAATLTGTVQIGAVVTGTGVTAGTSVSNQLFGATGVSIGNCTLVTGTVGQNTLSFAGTLTGVPLVGQLLCGNGAVITGIPPSTYITAINGTTITISNTLTTGYATSTVYFYTPGGLGNYTVSTSTSTISAAAATFSGIVGVGTNFVWDSATGDQVWIGDELRTLNITQNYALPTSAGPRPDIYAYTTDYVGYTGTPIGVVRQVIQGAQLPTYRREESYLPGNATSFLNDLRVGDDLLIDGSEYTVQLITSTNQVKLSSDITHTAAFNNALTPTTLSITSAPGTFTCTVTSAAGIAVGQYVTGPGIPIGTAVTAVNGSVITLSNAFVGTGNTTGSYTFYNGSTIYKKKKIHGYTLEGTREGWAVSGTTNVSKFSGATTNVVAAGTSTAYLGNNTISVVATPTVGAYNIVKIEGAGGTPYQLSGQVLTSTTTLTGTNTQFTTQLHIGAEIIIGGQHVYIVAIASDISATLSASVTQTTNTPYYRSVPLYTRILSVSGSGPYVLTLDATIKNTVYSTGANPNIVYTPSNNGDFIEYVYSSTNTAAETSALSSNTSLDRKYFGFRYFPLWQSTLASPVTTATVTLNTLLGAYSMPVYERWAAAWGQANGVGVNLADQSGGTVINGSQVANTLTLTNPISGQIAPGMNMGGAAAINNIPFTTTVTGTIGAAGSTYSGLTASQTVTGPATIIGQLGTASDIVTMTHSSGGYIYLYANNRYAIIQGKSMANVQSNWIGCVEFERAQPEDISVGSGSTSGVSYQSFGTSTTTAAGSPAINMYPINPVEGVISFTTGTAPWPCYGYLNGNRMPVGANQIPTAPQAQQFPVHGNVISVPRVRNSAGDLVGINAHTYSAFTITTGRWGHLFELGGNGSHTALTSASLTAGVFPTAANATIVPHVGQIVPVYTNVYNSKRFMFSPVVVLGPAYDPDVRGRLYGLKVIPSALGTLMDTVSITSDNQWFYNTASGAQDHWVITSPPSGSPQGTIVNTYRIQPNAGSSAQSTIQSYRSLQDTSPASINTSSLFPNDFRWAIPA